MFGIIKALFFFYQSKYDEAVEAYDEAIRIDPSYVDAWTNKGLALWKLEKNEEAIQAYDEAIRLQPRDVSAWNNKGSALFDLNMFDEANKAFDEVIRLASDDPVARYNKGNALYGLGNYTGAIELYNESIEMGFPKESWALHKIGNALMMLHRNSEAEATYAKARELGFNGPMTEMEMAASG
jgi:tetratricopeptide (TPR) repeat protein